MGIATSTPSATTGAEGTIKLAGDLGGTASAPTVTGITGAVVNVADLANGTDGELITWDSSGVATTVAVGTSGQVLTSNGAGAAPTFQNAAGGLSWGATAAGTSGTGIALTISNSSSAGTIGLTVTRGNTQTSDGHIGIQVDMGTDSTFNAPNYNFIAINRSGNNQGNCFYADGTTADAPGTVGFYATLADSTLRKLQPGGGSEGTGLWVAMTYNRSQSVANGYVGTDDTNHFVFASTTSGYGGLYMSLNGSHTSAPHAWRMTYLRDLETGVSTARTTDVNDWQSSRSHTTGTRTDDYDMFSISRTTISNHASAVITSQGSVLRLENVATQTLGTLTDSVTPLLIVQDADSTGHPISITQNAVVSTNFKKILSLAGVTVWISDGTTPNGALTGTAGDICLNGASSQSFYCTGTTNWTGM